MNKQGDVLWEPSTSFQKSSRIVHYMNWLQQEKGVEISDYEALWDWSVNELDDFWGSIWDYFEVKGERGSDKVLSEAKMPGAKWFPDATVNYTEEIFRNRHLDTPAIMFKSETRELAAWSWDKLYGDVSAFAKGLRRLGVAKGDRVAAYLPNIPETIVAFLACASIGATWSVASPDFGSETVISRFKQIEPKVLIAVDGYKFGGRAFDRIGEVETIRKEIPTIENTVLLPYLTEDVGEDARANYVLWNDFIAEHETTELIYEALPFEHPLWILYSSGTTGIPKAIVQGQGNILLEHYKSLALHMNIGEGDRLFWFTTTGWMIWNMLISGLLLGATVVLYDGSPTTPSPDVLWKFAEETKIKVFGTSPPFLLASKQFGVTPKDKYNLENMTAIASTGAPLSGDMFKWVYENVKDDVWLGSASGGTDICSGFVMPSPLHPVRTGDIQCLALGSKVAAYNEAGEAVIDEVGELVVEAPMPSMPIYFWNDESGEIYYDSYFEMYEGVWTQGDWIKIAPDGSNQIYGRSDSTINRGGVRIGTSEIYRVVESMPDIQDSLVIDLTKMDGEGRIQLFVVLKDAEAALDSALITQIKEAIKQNCSPRHMPDDVYLIKEVPRTLNGKKLEVPVKRLLSGESADKVVNRGSMSNPEAIDYFINLAEKIS
ncbi:MAG TPA: acetoacetate--CoA ligase [Pseudogracilibacillus sp.]|nr:acetoacetate--CoA ligase [Pseudogracilibacillus sp.]